MELNVFGLAALAAVSTLVAGAFPLLASREFSARALSRLVALSAGILLSVGLLEMLPESFEIAGQSALVAVGIGFILLYLVEKITLIHVCRDQDCDVHAFSSTALIGIGFHSFVDGFAIAVSGQLNLALGLLVAVAVLVHRIPDGVSVAAVMLSHGYEKARTWLILILISVLALVGAVVGVLIPISPGNSLGVLGVVLALSAGTFIYVSTNDLLPEAHRQAQDYGVPVLFVVGFFGFFAVGEILPHLF